MATSRRAVRPALCAAALCVAGPAAAGIDDLGWMAGCWFADGQAAGSVEYWMEPAGGTMFGVSRSVRNGATVFFEYLQIRDSGDGGMVLIASPSGQESAHFRMVEIGAQAVVFENPEHDFPQRIAYRLTAPGKLLGRIEGSEDGQARSAEFPMTRIACAGDGAEH